MAIGDNIRKFRKLKGMTQKELGLALGFDKKTADIRIAQYESGTRKPKEDMINDLSKFLIFVPMLLLHQILIAMSVLCIPYFQLRILMV